MMICQLERSFPSSQLCRVLWIGVCLISPRRASSIIASRDILEDYRRRQEKERQLAGEKSLLRLFSGVTGCTKKIVVVLFALPVDNCYSSFISASYLSQNIRICRQQQSRKMECSQVFSSFDCSSSSQGLLLQNYGELEEWKANTKGTKTRLSNDRRQKISSQQFWFQLRFQVWYFEFSRHFQTGWQLMLNSKY